MRARSYIAVTLGVVVAAGIAATVWAVTRSSPPPSAPASPLAAAQALTCAGQARSCTAPGTVRWSVPLQAAVLDRDGTVHRPTSPAQEQAMLGYQGPGIVAPAFDPVATVSGGLLVYQQGGLVVAIGTATGQVRWRVRLPVSAAAQSFAGTWWNTNLPPAVAGGQVAVTTMSADGEAEMAWLLDAATGTVRAHLELNGNDDAVLAPTPGGVVVEAALTKFMDLDWTTAAVRWQVSVPSLSSGIQQLAVVAGTVAFAQDGNTVQRVDLEAGRLLPAVQLPAGLGDSSTLSAVPAEPGADELIENGYGRVAVIDPAMGRVAWSVPGKFRGLADGLRVDPASSPPTGVYITQGHRMVTVNLTSGRPVRTVTLSGTVFTAYSGGTGALIQMGQNPPGLPYHSLIVTNSAYVPAKTQTPEWGRLTGIDPRTGAHRWTGPWTSSNLDIIGWTAGGPPEIIAESCAPDGMHLSQPLTTVSFPAGTCSKARLFAINA